MLKRGNSLHPARPIEAEITLPIPLVYTFSTYTAVRRGSGAVTMTLTDDIEVQ